MFDHANVPILNVDLFSEKFSFCTLKYFGVVVTVVVSNLLCVVVGAEIEDNIANNLKLTCLDLNLWIEKSQKLLI